jgi:ribonuclease BN (tRNA processing enzyme)
VRLRLLGSGGFVPTDRRETACALVRDGDHALLLDAGTGASRLLADRSLLDGVERLDVVLTHFHLDHTGGLFYLADLHVPFTIWGAGKALEGTSTEELVHRLLDSPFAPPGFSADYAVDELEVGEAAVGRFAVRSRIQRRHGNPTLALRLGDDLAWCTDTASDEDNVDFVRDVAVLAHEAFHAADETDDRGHTAAGEAARLARAAGAGRLVLVHVNPTLAEDEELLRYARPHFRETVVGVDGLEL